LKVEKWLWTDADFERMGWHDVHLHGVAINERVERTEKSELHLHSSELMLDIDYILKWVKPETTGESYKFWLAPSTLVFDGPYELEIKSIGHINWEISEIVRERTHYPTGTAGDCWKWEIHGPEMTFLARGYKQYIKREPTLSWFQSLTYEERGGASFSKQTWIDQVGKTL
jgi:hypothetical protein